MSSLQFSSNFYTHLHVDPDGRLGQGLIHVMVMV